jgi:hypothetical protein
MTMYTTKGHTMLDTLDDRIFAIILTIAWLPLSLAAIVAIARLQEAWRDRRHF